MKFPGVYHLSANFGPPKVNLRQGRILDDFGSDTYATLPTNHRHPNDVTREELEFYSDVFSFLEVGDLLFYLHPVFREYELEDSAEFIGSFMFNLDRCIREIERVLDAREIQSLRTGLYWFQATDSRSDQYWHSYPNLVAFYDRHNTHCDPDFHLG